MRFYDSCVDTSDGTRVPTHCLYPSFEVVNVFVVKHGDGYIIHDGGGAAGCAWAHGRDEDYTARFLKAAALRFACEVQGKVITANVETSDWLQSAIVSVANAASDAASAAVGKSMQSTKEKLATQIQRILERSPRHIQLDQGVEIQGKSGKTHTFDLAIRLPKKIVLIDTVVPHPASIAAKYVAFSDTGRTEAREKFAVYDRELERSDKVLLGNVADLVHFSKVKSSHGEVFL